MIWRFKTIAAILVLVYILTLGPGSAEAAALLPDIGDARAEVERQYGEAYLVQEDQFRIWNSREWEERSKTNPLQPKAYGYLFPIEGINATLWIEYDNKERVRKEMLLWEGTLKIRHFGQYFPDLYNDIVRQDSMAARVKGYPKEQLAVRIGKNGQAEQWIRFLVASDEKTRINMHTRIKGFELVDNSQDISETKVPIEGVSGKQAVKKVTAFPAEGTWEKVDNYFLSKLYFSEQLVARKKTDLIVIHHAAMPTTTSREDIHDLHLTFGWAGIGYHKLVFADGSVADGRYEGMVGAHAIGVNQHSIGIVLVGDFGKGRPPQAQLKAAAKLTVELMKKYHISVAGVQPHREATEGTDCPGAQFPWQEFTGMLTTSMEK